MVESTPNLLVLSIKEDRLHLSFCAYRYRLMQLTVTYVYFGALNKSHIYHGRS